MSYIRNQDKLIIIFKSGIITILSMLIWSFLIFSINIPNSVILVIQYFLYAMGIYSSQYFYKKEYQKLSYIQAFSLGYLITLIVSTFYGVITFLGLKFDKANNINNIKQKIIEVLKSKDLDDAAIKSFTSNIENYFSPFDAGIGIFLFMFILGLILSSIVSIFSKSNNNG